MSIFPIVLWLLLNVKVLQKVCRKWALGKKSWISEFVYSDLIFEFCFSMNLGRCCHT